MIYDQMMYLISAVRSEEMISSESSMSINCVIGIKINLIISKKGSCNSRLSVVLYL